MIKPVKSHGFTALGPMHEALARLSGWKAHAMAVFLGAVGALAFAPFHFSLVLAFSFTGLVWMVDGARGAPKWAQAVFARGWAFGFGFFLVSLHWTVFPFLVEPEKHAIFLFMPLILLPGGLALIWGAGVTLAGTFWSSSPSRVFIFALFFSMAEYVRGHLFGGFPWNLPGTTWAPGGAISQAASIGGVYWLTLLTIFVMASPAALVDTRETRALSQRLLPALFAVILVGLGWTLGARRLSEPTLVYPEQFVTLMDAGVPEDAKYRSVPDTVLRRYLEMLNNGPAEPGDIVIWPEAAIPLPLLQSPNALDAISAYIGDKILITGTARRQPASRTEEQLAIGAAPAAEDEVDWFNSLAVLNRNSNRSGPIALYDKHRLVPFGELSATDIIPGGQFIRGVLPDALQRIVPSGFAPGPGPAVVYADGVPPFNALICYEGLYSSIPRSRAARPRAEWIVVISNDAWFGVGMGPAQHAAQNRYRSIESGLPMARVASRGATAMYDGMGRRVAKGEPVAGDPQGWHASAVRAQLPVALPATAYFRHGDVVYGLSLAMFSLLAFLAWRR